MLPSKIEAKDLYRYIKTPDSVYRELHTQIEKHRPIKCTSHLIIRDYDIENYPNTKKFLDSTGLDILGYRIFFCPPRFSEALVHIDAFDLQAAFNIPLEKGSVMQWFTEHPNTSIQRLYPDGKVRVILAYEKNLIVKEEDFDQYVREIREYTIDWHPTFSANLNKSIVVNTTLWHRPVNHGDSIRALYSFVFRGNPSYKKIIRCFEDEDLIEET